MSAHKLTHENLAALVGDLLDAGIPVAAPARPAGEELAPGGDELDYRWLAAQDEIVLGRGGLPRRSLKEFFLPSTEALLRWRQLKDRVTIEEIATEFEPRVLLGVRPCDVAALEVVDRVMGWDYRDELWFGRRKATTIISLACSGLDGSCFCSAVGLGPDATRGADVVLVPVPDGYAVEVLTDKGRDFLQKHAARFTALEPAQEPEVQRFRQQAREKVAGNLPISAQAVQKWLERNFEHPYWSTIALRCHGCGTCASVCPTCHCFDIVDEPQGLGQGTRRRNWDTCQSARFTVHGSGHNPRAQQNPRFRQRVMHKFAIYPARFQEVLCTGCGRCVRACPGGMDLLEVLGEINALAQAEPQTKAQQPPKQQPQAPKQQQDRGAP